MEIQRGASREIISNWPGVVWIDLDCEGGCLSPLITGKQDVRPMAPQNRGDVMGTGLHLMEQ